jgi:CRISPR-associated protein Cmr1
MRGHTIRATYRLVTPTFLAGADQKDAELRPPSIKSALRFWWRALAYSHYKGDLEQIAKRESLIFGSTEQQGVFHLSISTKHELHKVRGDIGEVLRDFEYKSPNVVGSGALYLAYGVANAFASRPNGTPAGLLTRGHLKDNQEFSLTLIVRNDAYLEELYQVVELLGLVGGLGSKSRKGYGSLTIKELNLPGWQPAKTAIEVSQRLTELLGSAMAYQGLPSYTAFSSNSRFEVISGTSESALDLLDWLGAEMIRFRSWGRNGTIATGEPRESNHAFRDDHDMMRIEIPNGEIPTTHPKRAAFGLPHNYGQGPRNEVKPNQFERRASPLFIHIHQLDNKQKPMAVLLLMPAEFLPLHAKVRVGGQPVDPIPHPELWIPVRDYMNRIATNANARGGR